MIDANKNPLRILALTGSLRRQSTNRLLAQLASNYLQDQEDPVEFTIFNKLNLIEAFDEDLEAQGFPKYALELANEIRNSDGVFIVTPEYNGSVPGTLKNALDWLSRSDSQKTEISSIKDSPLFSKPVAVASASNGQFGGLWARDDLVKILKTQGARPISEPSVTIAHSDKAFNASGDLISSSYRSNFHELLDNFMTNATTIKNIRAKKQSATVTT